MFKEGYVHVLDSNAERKQKVFRVFEIKRLALDKHTQHKNIHILSEITQETQKHQTLTASLTHSCIKIMPLVTAFLNLRLLYHSE